MITDASRKIYPKTYKGITWGWGMTDKSCSDSFLEKNVNRGVYLCPEDSAHISSGPTFFRSSGKTGKTVSFTNL